MKTVTITMTIDGDSYTKEIDCEGATPERTELLFKAMLRAAETTFYMEWAKRITKEEAASVRQTDRFWHYLPEDKKVGNRS
jgi:hypothetical protein